jgi:hypothetical protein
MRYIGDIPNSAFKMGLYAWNGKYIVKIEAGLYEQTYKVSELDFVGNENDVRALMTNETFLKQVADRFRAMHDDFQTLLDL